MIKALIFDFDGTLVDTESPWYDLCVELYEEHGVELPLDEYIKCIGTDDSAFNVYSYLENMLGRPIDKDGIREMLRKRHSTLMDNVGLRHGVLAFLDQVARSGLPVGIASSSPRSWVLDFLTRFHIADRFHPIVTRDDVERVKPAPDLFLKAAEQLGCRRGEALIFEDSKYGAIAADAAGQPCVVIPNRVTAYLDFPTACARYAEFSDCELHTVLKLGASPSARTGSLPSN